MSAAETDVLVARLRAAGCVFAEEEAALLRQAAAEGGDLEELVAARVAGRPLEHVLGHATFDGLRVAVAPGVFVPRQRSLLLVELAARIAPPGGAVLDLCCGSGALLAALRRRRPDVVGLAADLDPDAVAVARRNLPGVPVWEGDLFDAVPSRWHGRLDVVVANAPYVPSDAVALMPAEARDHEHRLALDGGPDGLALHRRLLAQWRPWAAPDAVLLVEAAPRQVPELARIAAAHGLRAEAHSQEERGGLAVEVRLAATRGIR
ncbi:putative protein N(5)-glutamine methyltransferase [Nocardioides sp.]|uniref:putative protein N(5)-glutamine methyltransferase n=1 Tax=Nocardioides sp. TaxID=35761 RepID=UPI003518E5AD